MSERGRVLLFRALIVGLVLIAVLPAMTTLAYLLTQPQPPDGDTLTVAAAVTRFLATITAGALSLVLAWRAGAVRNLTHSYRRADPDQRKRAFWLFEGLLLFVGGVLVIPTLVGVTVGAAEASELNFPEFDSLLEIVDAAFVVAAVICIAFATFYRGALDPRLLVRNTAIYGVLAIVLLVGFVGLENLVATQISRALGLASGVGTWITGIIAALSITPLHGWLRRKILPPENPDPTLRLHPQNWTSV